MRRCLKVKDVEWMLNYISELWNLTVFEEFWLYHAWELAKKSNNNEKLEK